MVTKSEILMLTKLLDTNPKAVELAMVILHDRTPVTERPRLIAIHGLCDRYKKLGERYARRVWEGQSLTEKELKTARKIATFHIYQLAEALKASHFLDF